MCINGATQQLIEPESYEVDEAATEHTYIPKSVSGRPTEPFRSAHSVLTVRLYQMLLWQTGNIKGNGQHESIKSAAHTRPMPERGKQPKIDS
jgi:hypothetical protein